MQPKKPFFKIDAAGTVTVGDPPGLIPQDFKKQPVRFSVHRDLRIELHCEHFSAEAQLDMDEAMSLAMLLLYATRERLYLDSCQKTEYLDRDKGGLQ